MHDIFDNAPARKGEMDERAAASAPLQSWRDVIKVHPAAQVFPLMDKDELAALARDIKAHGLEIPVTLWSPGDGQPDLLLDGRNRLDALELAGNKTIDFDRLVVPLKILGSSVDPFAYVISANIRRRHLSIKQKRNSIAALLKMAPEKSDRQIGKMMKADHKTVGAVRREREVTGEASPVDKRVGADGKARRRPVHKPHTSEPNPPDERTDAAKAGTEKTDAAVTTAEPVIADAELLSAIFGAARDDIGPASAGETARLTSRVNELQNENRRLEIEVVGLRSEIDELKAAATTAKPAIAAARDHITSDNDNEFARKLTRLNRFEIEVTQLRGERSALRSEVKELKVEVARLKRENDALRAGGSKPDAAAEVPELSACSEQGAGP